MQKLNFKSLKSGDEVLTAARAPLLSYFRNIIVIFLCFSDEDCGRVLVDTSAVGHGANYSTTLHPEALNAATKLGIDTTYGLFTSFYKHDLISKTFGDEPLSESTNPNGWSDEKYRQMKFFGYGKSSKHGKSGLKYI